MLRQGLRRRWKYATQSEVISPSLTDADNGLEKYGGFIDKSGAARLAFEQRCLDFKECILQDMLKVRAIERVNGRKMEERRELLEMNCMKVFM